MASLDLSAAFDKVNIDLLERKITNRLLFDIKVDILSWPSCLALPGRLS